jgi:hypothetical protein
MRGRMICDDAVAGGAVILGRFAGFGVSDGGSAWLIWGLPEALSTSVPLPAAGAGIVCVC